MRSPWALMLLPLSTIRAGALAAPLEFPVIATVPVPVALTWPLIRSTPK